MSRRSLLPASTVGLVVLVASLLLHACQGSPAPSDPVIDTGPRTLTVGGAGSGVGLITAPNYGEAGALDCTVSGGTADPIDCVKTYGWKTEVELTAAPQGGSTFDGWTGACSGSELTCTVVITEARMVTATFTGSSLPSFVLNVNGGGNGSGLVKSQLGLSPAINCTITSGSPVSGGCSARYPQGTVVTLAATSVGGHTFDGWTGDCDGTDSCTIAMSANRVGAVHFSAPPGIEATMGKWDAPRATPIVGIHLNLLSTGQMLVWGHMGEPQLWNLAGGFTEVSNVTCTEPALCELFCAGHTFLADGRLLVAGGHVEALGDDNGIKDASIFDGTSWQVTGSMAYPRWYPTLVTLENGDVVALSGNQLPGIRAAVPERYSGGRWWALTGARFPLALYPRAFLEPKNGYVFIAGEDAPRFLDPSGSGRWLGGQPRIVANRNYGSAVMLDSKVLYVGGGGESDCPAELPQTSAEIIDLAAPTPAWMATGSMSIGRRQTNATILPDGTVLVTGGTSQCGFTNEAGAVFTAELWDPTTGQWTQLANASVTRVYHAATLLLPDGRVLSTGSGDGGGTTSQYSYEIFSPPYLFKGPRPTYNLVSTGMRYGQPFAVVTPDGASIRKATLIRLTSSTHAFDMGQRLNTLAFQLAEDGKSLRLTPPASGRIAPPGPYLLFIMNDKGVPSVAQTILLGP